MLSFSAWTLMFMVIHSCQFRVPLPRRKLQTMHTKWPLTLSLTRYSTPPSSPAQVVVYNHMKLQAIRAKVAATSGKDEEKGALLPKRDER